MQDLLHIEQLCSLFKLLKPFVKTLGPVPFVLLVYGLLAFFAFESSELFGLAHEVFGLAHQILAIIIMFVKAALAAFFISHSSSSISALCRHLQTRPNRTLCLQASPTMALAEIIS